MNRLHMWVCPSHDLRPNASPAWEDITDTPDVPLELMAGIVDGRGGGGMGALSLGVGGS